MKNLKSAFTLAEILVSLAIIGVIAAVTLPALNTDVSKRAVETQIVKFYNTVTNAAEQFKNDSQVDSLADLDMNDDDVSGFLSYFKSSGVCPSFTSQGCFASTYTNAVGTKVNTANVLSGAGTARYLQDGSVFAVLGANSSGIRIAVDINGAKKPNRFGYDFWRIAVLPDGSVDSVGMIGMDRSDTTKMSDYLQNKAAPDCREDGLNDCFAHIKRNNFKLDD